MVGGFLVAHRRNGAWAVAALAALLGVLTLAQAQPEPKGDIVEPRNAPSLAEVAPETVAEVNGTRLTREQLGGLAVGLYGRSVMEALIAGELVRQEAGKQSISITSAEIDAYAITLAGQELDILARRNGYKSFAALETSGSESKETLAELRRRTVQRIHPLVGPELLTQKLVRKNITVTPEDLQQAYERTYGPRAEIMQLVLDTEKDAADAEKKLKLGADFAKLARTVSTDRVSAAEGGKMPPLPPGSILGAAAFRLQPGELSKVIQTPNGFHLIKLVRLLPASDQRFADVREKIEQELIEKRVHDERAKWLADLHRKAIIKRHF